MVRTQHLEEKLRAAFSPSFLQIEDESHLHVGHGPYQANGGSHFRIVIVSSHFKGKSLLERHRAIYACLSEELRRGIHALSLKALSPEEQESGAPE